MRSQCFLNIRIAILCCGTVEQRLIAAITSPSDTVELAPHQSRVHCTNWFSAGEPYITQCVVTYLWNTFKFKTKRAHCKAVCYQVIPANTGTVLRYHKNTARCEFLVTVWTKISASCNVVLFSRH